MLTAKFNCRLTFIFLLPSEGDVLLSLASVMLEEGAAVSLIAPSSYLVT